MSEKNQQRLDAAAIRFALDAIKRDDERTHFLESYRRGDTDALSGWVDWPPHDIQADGGPQ